MAGRRRPQNENDGFIDISGPPRKRQRRFPQVVTQSMHEAAQIEWELRQREQAEAQAEALAQLRCDEEAERKAEATFRLSQVLGAMKTAGYRTLHEFLAELLAAKDQHQSSQVSQMLINHGHELLDLIRLRQPEMVAQWISKAAGGILAEEGAKLAQLLRPPQHQSVTATLQSFSLERILADAESIAPTLCMLLRMLARGCEDSNVVGEGRRNIDLVITTVICMLAQTRNEKSSEYQTTMAW